MSSSHTPTTIKAYSPPDCELCKTLSGDETDLIKHILDRTMTDEDFSHHLARYADSLDILKAVLKKGQSSGLLSQAWLKRDAIGSLVGDIWGELCPYRGVPASAFHSLIKGTIFYRLKPSTYMQWEFMELWNEAEDRANAYATYMVEKMEEGRLASSKKAEQASTAQSTE